MNIRDMVVPVGCALVMVFALNYFFPGSTVQQESASTFVVPREKKAYKPLNEEINFYHQKNVSPAQITELSLPWATLNFSTEGASLESADFNRESNGENKTIRTIFPVGATNREDRCLLVALADETPFSYTLRSSQENENTHELSYSAENDTCVIQKTFIVDKNNPKIDLVLDIAPKNGTSGECEPRIFFPAPLMLDLKEADVISSIVMDRTHTFAKKAVSQLDVHSGWFSPEIFGTDSRYFINALIKDDNHFTQRAYYKLEDRTRLFSILEGPAVTEKTSWKLSFYFGPKELKALAAVDNRLEKTLDYSGILSSLAKLMLYVLNWLYKYLHNYGLAIIVLTLLIQLLMLPISLRNNEEKWKIQQMEYQRELAYIEQRFKDRPDQLLAERTELIKRKGLPGFGCLIPLLIQLPLFFALSRVLSSSFELYQAPMLWIPDLSQRDPYFILPILLTVAMLAQDTKGDAQQRMTKTVMAVVFGVLTAGFSAGLALYICASRVFGFIQTKLMHYFRLV
jgi:YidC/Oxa1 family membrane protein insertase